MIRAHKGAPAIKSSNRRAASSDPSLTVSVSPQAGDHDAKNPFRSAYLSAANKVANTACGKARNEVKRESTKQETNMTNAWLNAWTAKPIRKRKSR